MKQDEVDFIGTVVGSIPEHTYLKDLFTPDFLNWITRSIYDDADCNLWLHWQREEARSTTFAEQLNITKNQVEHYTKQCAIFQRDKNGMQADRDEAQTFSVQVQTDLVEATMALAAVKAHNGDLITVSKGYVEEISLLKSMLTALVMDTSETDLKTAARMLVYAWNSS